MYRSRLRQRRSLEQFKRRAGQVLLEITLVRGEAIPNRDPIIEKALFRLVVVQACGRFYVCAIL